MSIGNDMSPADIRACTEGNSGYGGGMGWGVRRYSNGG